MKASYLLAAALFLAGVSCERHKWEEVEVLHQPHGGHGHGEGHHGEGETGGEAHEKPADH